MPFSSLPFFFRPYSCFFIFSCNLLAANSNCLSVGFTRRASSLATSPHPCSSASTCTLQKNILQNLHSTLVTEVIFLLHLKHSFSFGWSALNYFIKAYMSSSSYASASFLFLFFLLFFGLLSTFTSFSSFFGDSSLASSIESSEDDYPWSYLS